MVLEGEGGERERGAEIEGAHGEGAQGEAERGSAGVGAGRQPHRSIQQRRGGVGAAKRGRADR